ncbi:circularly permuted type 2 ATP-grasp protein [Ottowia thiooxydans]|uniref:circularly permuted type 2 ATP-grasp protein n=1 Tax=Ottowia thiooxydans TaxID=219182 RepID=UPI000400FD02|nr:circularly permuted type 2 ATP-grasp protein [Ottowia thiooxydans]
MARENSSDKRVLNSESPSPLLGTPALPAGAHFPTANTGHYDELHASTAPQNASLPWGSKAPLAPAWAQFFHHLGDDGWNTLNRRASLLERQLRDNGVTYNVSADETNMQRPWPLDLFPLLISSQDWRQIEAGVLQRVRLLDAVMADVYGERRLLKDGLLPAALVQGHPEYLRSMHGAPPVGGVHLHIAAFDLARGPNGHWWVVSQRTQAPSGLGYLLENRLAVSSQFPRAFQAMNVRRLAATYRSLIENLKRLAPAGADSHIAMLTPGPHNETYFEQSYLARYLGVTLATGGDLTVRNERLYLKTLRGLQPVHCLIKRVDDAFIDPLEMRPDSRLGVPGLLQAVRAGNVLVANAPGAGFLESSALLGFLPSLARHLLGESLKLPSLHTWWCGEPAAMKEVLPILDRCVIKATYPWSLSRSNFQAGVGPLMSPEVLRSWAENIRRAPDEHTVQAYLPPSQMPTWLADQQAPAIVPQSAILRVFAISDGIRSWQVLPGGMTRLVSASAGLASMAMGGSSADTWVLNDEPLHEDMEVDYTSLVAITPSATSLVRRERLITSRAAENLFWLGRYTERAENSTRLARIILQSLDGDEQPSYPLLMWLGQLAASAGLVPEDTPSPLDDRYAFEHALIRSLGDTEIASVGYTLSSLRQAGAALRERLSPEHWSLIKEAEESFLGDCGELGGSAPSSSDALRALARSSKALAGITGAQNDSMWRDDGWRLLFVGRHIERLTHLAGALSLGFYTNAVHDAAGYGVVLDLFDSTISFHARYQRSRAIAALIEHVVMNHQNPRSLGWVTQGLNALLKDLHQHEQVNLEDLSLRLRPLTSEELPRLCEANDIGDFTHLQEYLTHCIDTGSGLSREISLRHFTHTGEAGRSVGA